MVVLEVIQVHNVGMHMACIIHLKDFFKRNLLVYCFDNGNCCQTAKTTVLIMVVGHDC